MKENFTVNNHSSIRIQGEKVVFYIDPFNIDGTPKDADVILITHLHHDHLSIDDIKKVMNDKTFFLAPQDCISKLIENSILGKIGGREGNWTMITEKSFGDYWFFFDGFDYDFNAKVMNFRAYNIDKFRSPNVPYHPKENNWVGYVLEIDGKIYVICGDTDFTTELRELKNSKLFKDIDVLFVPIGSIYTMTAKEASEFVNTIKPKLVVPVHYNSLVGTKDDEKIFIENLDKQIPYKIML